MYTFKKIHKYINIYAAISIYIYTEIKLMENGNFSLFSANRKRNEELHFVFCKRKTLIDMCNFSKRAYLYFTHIEGTNIF